MTDLIGEHILGSKLVDTKIISKKIPYPKTQYFILYFNSFRAIFTLMVKIRKLYALAFSFSS